MDRPKLIAGNWKMNGSLSTAVELVNDVITEVAGCDKLDIVVCPPFPLLIPVAQALAGSKIALGAQTVSQHAQGAYTGEVACSMLAELDCSYVIVGHSERRQFFGETSDQVADKAAAVAAANMIPIVCVGELLAERQREQTEAVVKTQLQPLLDRNYETFGNLVVAYEPVWAIGTGETASPEQAQAVHAYIRGLLKHWNVDAAAKTRILYGGSVKPDNAGSLLSMPDVDGGLIGGASLQAGSFAAICKAV